MIKFNILSTDYIKCKKIVESYGSSDEFIFFRVFNGHIEITTHSGSTHLIFNTVCSINKRGSFYLSNSDFLLLPCSGKIIYFTLREKKSPPILTVKSNKAELVIKMEYGEKKENRPIHEPLPLFTINFKQVKNLIRALSINTDVIEISQKNLFIIGSENKLYFLTHDKYTLIESSYHSTDHLKFNYTLTLTEFLSMLKCFNSNVTIGIDNNNIKISSRQFSITSNRSTVTDNDQREILKKHDHILSLPTISTISFDKSHLLPFFSSVATLHANQKDLQIKITAKKDSKLVMLTIANLTTKPTLTLSLNVSTISNSSEAFLSYYLFMNAIKSSSGITRIKSNSLAHVIEAGSTKIICPLMQTDYQGDHDENF